MKRQRVIGILAAVFVISAAAVSAVWAYGPGDYVHGGPGDSAPAQNNGTIYDYPGFKGKGPMPYEMVVSWNYEEEGPSGPAYSAFGGQGPYEQGWRYSPDGWWYQYSDGSWPANGWKCIDSRWYYFGETGHLITGWLNQNGVRYYLNPVDDGTLGSMRTGWQMIDGKMYYFNGSSDGVLGALLVSTTTPDGYQVGADGALVQ